MPVTKSILVVDDEPDVSNYVDAILSEMGNFKIIPSYDGLDWQNKAKTEKQDLIILNVMMPEKDGFKVFLIYRKIRK